MIVRNPDAAVILFNYRNRTGSEGLSTENIDSLDNAYIIKDPIISIRTSKQKMSPVGSFEIVLAPTRNWTSFVTPGSWLIIHMSNKKLTDDDLQKSGEGTLKMIGRVDTVRVGVGVDQTTGARQTSFIVAGRDWGQIFESNIYIDPTAAFKDDQPLGAVTRFDFNEKFLNLTKDNHLPTTTELTQFFISIWGKSSVDNIFAEGPLNANRYSSHAEFVVPQGLANYIQSDGSQKMADMVKVVSGKLSGHDSYVEVDEAVSMVDGHSIVGMNTVWQLINLHSCPIVNELIADLRWEVANDPIAEQKPSLALYKRIKPFAITQTLDEFDSSTLTSNPTTKAINKTQNNSAGNPLLIGGVNGPNTDKITSSFFNVRKHAINAEDIISIDAGTNWRDSVNFIELLPDLSWISIPSGTASTVKIQNKNDSAVFDPSGTMIARDGIRPMMFSTTACPPTPTGAFDPFALKEWLPVLKNWYFDTHKMLNGSVSMMGQTNYISVGSNILFDAKFLGSTNYSPLGGDTSVLAHVESVGYSFTTNDEGSRSFTTVVSFVRGVITDQGGNKTAADNGLLALTDSTNLLTPSDLDVKNTFLIGGG